ncbi:LysR family transcriptional regulator [Beggiatoa leptomitoformis]|uniref:LysR family transcriptional regulator n=1 Tax=Beggiatoa leptomitoformis TaxID=288004 RepID=A0A2N9YD28_9GAMM|nr:LysR family transcriptional regulator [Beggiatoa leptomitoformis]ALG69211.1 LysR family transcriptional regulator [Beggiatoa leptomitoformis]AUI68357.1 LysR family transcriptional regulator [Beggiatoa leptomitoformis]
MSNERFYYKQNRLKQLRAFCHAAQTGSISKAADRLFLSQPSVSLQIKALERELDISLFERRGPSIELTPEGKILYELATPLVEGIDSLTESFAVRRGNLESGELNITAGESTILYILPDVMKRFASAYPGIRLRLHNVTGRDGMALLRANEVDFAVGSFLDIPDDIMYFPIYYYDTVLITPKNHPLAQKPDFRLEDISQYGLILPPRHLSTWRMVKMVFQQHNLDYKVTLEAGGWEVIKKYVALGLGISIVTSICLMPDDPVEVLSLEQYFPKRSYGVILRRGKFLSPGAKRFIEMMDADFFKRDL